MDELLKKWDEILEHVKKEYELTDISFNTWVKPLKPSSIEDNVLYILLPQELEQMALNHIKRKFALPIKVAIAEITDDASLVSSIEASSMITNFAGIVRYSL